MFSNGVHWKMYASARNPIKPTRSRRSHCGRQQNFIAKEWKNSRDTASLPSSARSLALPAADLHTMRSASQNRATRGG